MHVAVGLPLLTALSLQLGLLTALVLPPGFAAVLELSLVDRVGFEPAVLLATALSLLVSASSLGLLLPIIPCALFAEPLSRFDRLAGLIPLGLSLALPTVGLPSTLLASFLLLSAFGTVVRLPFALVALVVSPDGTASPPGIGGRLTVVFRPFVLTAAMFWLGTSSAGFAALAAAERAVEPAPIVAVLPPVGTATLLAAAALLAGFDITRARAFGSPLASPSSIAVVAVGHGYHCVLVGCVPIEDSPRPLCESLVVVTLRWMLARTAR
ncbi:hypothetical protein ACFR99_08035 [Haloarchaeobius amylolyticus]|uniref:Uncharacterized protein n=1 Tax=Haloarchaeobius amylolyticus TaxID=1198296 RepID=A0ABD6BEJ6_9EURY